MKKAALVVLVLFGCVASAGCKSGDITGPPAAPIAITTQSLPDGIMGEPYSKTIEASGGVPPYTWSVESNDLPSGLSLDGSTGEISGTPDAEAVYTFTIGVADAADKHTSKQFSITTKEPLSITTQSLPDGIIEASYSKTLEASGGVPPYTWSVESDDLPSGLTLDDSTGKISGTPDAEAVYTFTIGVADAEDGFASKQFSITTKETFGVDTNPTGDSIGGGDGYSRPVTDGDYRVNTLDELLDALEQAVAGQVVYVEADAEIDLSGEQNVDIAGGVTLASNRGHAGSQGALLYSDELETIPLFLVGGERVRVTGLRLRGPDQERRSSAYVLPNSRSIQSSYPYLEVDNCELWGWSHAAVFLREGATNAHIHHNYMHHNQRTGLGYGVCLDKADALIEANRFDWCRHHIAGTGSPGTSYEACYNLVLKNANGHSFDMHGGADRGDGTDIAGDWIKIHHNEFQATSVIAIVIRGRPTEGAEVHHNWFLHSGPSSAVRQLNATGNLSVYRNQYTSARTIK